MTKQFNISKQLFVQAYELVKANSGAAGVDGQTLDDFSANLKDNLYKLWNRMSSGTYFPPAVKAVPIPKKTGGERILGVPTVADRIAQMAVKLVFEPIVEPQFLEDSYGYRPNKSALDAVGVTRQRCWQYNWVLEFDIKRLFDNIPHDLLMKAVRKHTDCNWVILYIERWLIAPMQTTTGDLINRTSGTPQGSVISPILSNLFLHYVFDKWMQRNQSSVPWCRYADDGLLHCHSAEKAEKLRAELDVRFKSCGLELHPNKTQIVYCGKGKRKDDNYKDSFDFLGYAFRKRLAKNSKTGRTFLTFTPAISKSAKKAIRDQIRQRKIHRRTNCNIEYIASELNPAIMGWLNYYGRYGRGEMYPIGKYINGVLAKWASRKYKKLGRNKYRAIGYIERTANKRPNLFAHWKVGMRSTFA